MVTKKISQLAIIGLVLCFLISAKSAEAVSLFLKTGNESSSSALSILAMDTGQESINTVDGKIIFDSRRINCQAQAGAASIIGAWVNQPQVSDGVITFAGIIPGGFIGKGEVVSIDCQTVNGGKVPAMALALKAENFQAYLNNGIGQLAKVSIISNQSLSTAAEQALTQNQQSDKQPPEILALSIVNGGELADNNYLLVFNVADKQTGVASTAMAAYAQKLDLDKDYQKIIDSLAWTSVSSPAVLPQNFLQQYTYFKAVDAAGNIKLARLSPVKPVFAFENILMIAGVVVLIIIAGVLLFVLKLKRKRST